MRIGLPALGITAAEIIEEAQRAEADGFASMWFTSPTMGDPLVVMALAGRATSTIELGTSVLQTYPCHPVLQSRRVASVVTAIGVPARFTLGLGRSHRVNVEGRLGGAYDTPGRNTEEYVQVITQLLRGQAIDFCGAEYNVKSGPPELVGGAEIPVLLAALGPRLLRVAGQYTVGTTLWLANAVAIAEHIAPRVREAAAAAGRAKPRIVASLPVAVHDDVLARSEHVGKLVLIPLRRFEPPQTAAPANLGTW